MKNKITVSKIIEKILDAEQKGQDEECNCGNHINLQTLVDNCGYCPSCDDYCHGNTDKNVILSYYRILFNINLIGLNYEIIDDILDKNGNLTNGAYKKYFKK